MNHCLLWILLLVCCGGCCDRKQPRCKKEAAPECPSRPNPCQERPFSRFQNNEHDCGCKE